MTKELKKIVQEIEKNCLEKCHDKKGKSLCHQCAQAIHIVATHITPTPTPQPPSETTLKLEKRFGFKRK